MRLRHAHGLCNVYRHIAALSMPGAMIIPSSSAAERRKVATFSRAISYAVRFRFDNIRPLDCVRTPFTAIA